MILDDIRIATQDRIDNINKSYKDEIKHKALNIISSEPSDPFYRALSKKGLSFIAEVKKASPSKGLIVKDFNPTEIAKEYENINIDAISVLTEPHFFQGSTKILEQINQEVSTPLLRKDFIIDAFQIYEAKCIGASAILLICALLDRDKIETFYQIATSLNLDVLLEVHNKEELKVALGIDPKIIGINNRDLKTFKVDLSTTERLREYISANTIVVSESGYFNSSDVCRAKKANIDALLIGESFMRSKNKALHLRELRGIQ